MTIGPEGPYRAKVGSLLYLALVTRPDIACAVSKVAQFCNFPTDAASKAVDHLFRYINATKDLGITLGPSIEPVHTFCDAAHTTDPGLKSITGYMIRIGTSPIVWASKKQVLTTMSTMESELDALAHAVIPSLWVRDLLKDLSDEYIPAPITILQDNQGTIQHCQNEQSSNRTAHLMRRYHFVKQYIESQQIKLKYMPGTDMVADQLTKILPRVTHEKHCRQFMTTANWGEDPFYKAPIQEELSQRKKSIKLSNKELKVIKEVAEKEVTEQLNFMVEYNSTLTDCGNIIPMMSPGYRPTPMVISPMTMWPQVVAW